MLLLRKVFTVSVICIVVFISVTSLLVAQDATSTPVTAISDAEQFALAGVETNAEWSIYSPYIAGFDGVPMVLVPSGCFTIGANPVYEDEQDGNEVCFNEPFWIDQTEVTQKQFLRFGGVAANASYFVGDERPVENITWFEAHAFCELRDARLPTEAEWEYAARGPDNLDYPWGNEFDEDNLVYQHNSDDQTASVGSKTVGASWVGAFDMSGNAWEWTISLYDSYPYTVSDSRKSLADDSTDAPRVVRGGSWNDAGTDYLRSGNRHGLTPDNHYFDIGFRCMRPFRQ